MTELSSLSVCFIAGTLGQGGAERQLFYNLRALRRAGADVRLLSLTRGEFWEEKLREIGVPVTWVGQEGSRCLRVLRMLREVRRRPPDILQSQHFYTNLYVVAVARALGLRELGAIRNDGFSEVQGNGRLLGRMSLRAPRMLAANSRAGIRSAIALHVPPSRLRLLPNVVDTDQFQPAPPRDAGPLRLLLAGRLVEQKRVDRFLSILARLLRAGVDFQALIVGDGPLRAQLEEMASGLSLLPGRVEFRGAVRDMAPVYREADVCVLTSAWEGTPNVLLETMASGLPTVATRVGGVPEIVRHLETGYLVDPDDEESMTQALLRLSRDPGLRRDWGRRAREYVLTHHSVHRLPVFLEDLYQAALA